MFVIVSCHPEDDFSCRRLAVGPDHYCLQIVAVQHLHQLTVAHPVFKHLARKGEGHKKQEHHDRKKTEPSV